MAVEDPGPIPEENENIEDSIEDIIETIMAMPQFATGDPTAGGTSRQNALARELQLFLESVESYQNGEINWQQMSASTPSNLLEDEEFAGYYDELMSVFEAEEVVDILTTDPARLSEFEELQFSQTEQIITNSAFSFVGATPPVTTAGSGRSVVITGGGGVTGDFERIKNTGGRVFGDNVPVVDEDGNPVLDADGNPKTEYREGLLDVMVPYIPGISLPDWMPSAGVIFLPTIQEAVNKVGTIIEESGIEGAWEEGDIGEVLNDIGEIIVRSGEAAADKVRDVIGGILGGITDPTVAGGVLGTVIGTTFPSIPDWLPPLITDPRVYGAVRQVLTQNFNTPEDQFPPLTEEVDTETDSDPNTLFTNRGNNYFVSSEGDEYFQLAESEDFDFEFNGQYTREQLENTGLEVINFGTYQSLLDDLSFHALEEDIYQYSMEDLIARYEEEGGVLPSDWKLMDEESQYNFFLDDYFDIPPLIEDPDKDPDEDPDPDPDPDPDDDSDDDQDVTSIVEGLFADFLSQLDEEFTGQQEQINEIIQNFVDSLPDFDAMPTMEDIAEYFEVNGVTLSEQNFERIRQELADAGYLTQEQLTEALAGVATTEQVQEAIQNAGFATPEQVMQYLAEAGYATPEDITNALANSGFVTEDRLLQALAEAGYATPEQVQEIVDNAISNIVIPEGATAEEVRQLIQEAIDGIPEGISLSEVSDIVNEAIANIEFPESLSEGDVRGIVDSFGFATSEEVQAGFDDLNQRFEDAINGIATQFSDQEAEFLASITGLEASLIQSLAAVEGGLSAELEMLGTDLISLQEDVANRFDEFQQFTSEQFGLAADERRQLQEALIAANGDISQLSLDMQQQFEAFGGTINELFAGVGVDIEALRQGQITQDEALADFRAYTTEQFEAAADERLSLAEELINVNGQVTALSEDSQRRFEELGLSLTDLQNEFNVNFLALQEGQIDRDEAFAQFRDNITGRLDLAEDEREAILTRLEESERIYGEQQQELQQQILAGNVISALSAGGMFAPPAAPRTVPFKDYLETFTYAPSVKPLQVQKTQVPPQIDYVQEATRLALGKPAPTRKKGMLA